MATAYDAQVHVAGVRLEQCDVALPVQITHGRSGVTAQPDAPTCTFRYLGSEPPGSVGDAVSVSRPGADQATWNSDGVMWVDGEYSWLGYRDSVPKFVGSIAFLKANEVDGVVDSWDVACVGRQAALGRIKILMVRPVETDIERVQAIAAEVGYILNVVGTSDILLAADTLDTDALSALHQICSSAAGILWQGRSGDLWYGTANHRNLSVENVIDCEVILDGIAWDNDQENIVNSVTVTWGAESASDSIDSVWNYRTGGASDPGSGNVNTDGTTFLALSRLNGNGFDMAPILRQLPVGTAIYGQQKANADNYARWSVDGAVSEGSGWFLVPIQVVESGGSGVGNNADLAFRFGTTSQQQETFKDAGSIAEWGLRHLDVSTLLYDTAQAGQLGLLILGRRAQPYWRMPGVIADYRGTTAVQANRLDSLEMGEGATFPVPVTPGPTPGTQHEWTIEGWVEEWSTEGHRLQLAVSDRRRTGGTGLRDWAAMRDAGAWSHWQALKWINALVKGVDES